MHVATGTFKAYHFPFQKGDLLLMVNATSLCGLTHTQAVATLKATISVSQVSLGIMDGPETSFGASNFIPSWMYWQKGVTLKLLLP